jgi:CheY-like chemotaxis protein
MSIEVLLVDEDPDVLDIVSTFLEREGDLAVTTQTDPETALEDVRTGGYDAIVSDYTMPRMDGLELCRAIRDDGDSTPFFLFSAREAADVEPDAAAAGVTEFVQKGTGTEQYATLAEHIEAAV